MATLFVTDLGRAKRPNRTVEARREVARQACGRIVFIDEISPCRAGAPCVSNRCHDVSCRREICHDGSPKGRRSFADCRPGCARWGKLPAMSIASCAVLSPPNWQSTIRSRFELAINTKTAASIGTGLPPRLVPMADPERRADFNPEEREHENGVEPNHLLTYDPQCVEPARLKIRA